MASSFPDAAPHHQRPPLFSQSAPTCGVVYVALLFGRTDLGPGRIVRYVQGLVDDYGFPKPYPALHARAIVDHVVATSRWSREAVDQWCSDWLPPDTAASLDAAALAAAGAEMDAAAGNLKLIQGGRK